MRVCSSPRKGICNMEKENEKITAYDNGFLTGMFYGAVVGALLTIAFRGPPLGQSLEKKIVEPQETHLQASPTIK